MTTGDQTDIRLASFIIILLIVMLWELLACRRPLNHKRWVRWYSNLGIVIVNSVTVSLIFATSATAFAWHVNNSEWGIFSLINLPKWIEIGCSIIILDLLIYLQHLIFHRIPWLWRIHQMHHTDLDYDVTTALRFHPIEIVLSMAIKLSAIVIIGISPEAVLLFSIILNGMAMFNHGNIYLPSNLDSALRKLLVTPDMHRIHHSVRYEEMHTNFGFNLSWWDRLFSTYVKNPKDGQQEIIIGCPSFRDKKYLHLHWLIAQPFMKSCDTTKGERL
jgi:sterol desaturase/sphingolipid hydroxylase (fatty acid hydroxylase superfamily)